jgi:protein involved in polysaccharide export with SLBB domain
MNAKTRAKAYLWPVAAVALSFLGADDPCTAPVPRAGAPSEPVKPTAPKVDAQEPTDIRPLSLVPIPDDPPPHEGALIDIPYTIQPPDLLLVELLEALPGRPITGERLVRADGTITLGFYGDVHVRGLTLGQAKTKIIRHMQKFLSDETLGLSYYDDPSEERAKTDTPAAPPELAPSGVRPPASKEEKAPKEGSASRQSGAIRTVRLARRQNPFTIPKIEPVSAESKASLPPHSQAPTDSQSITISRPDGTRIVIEFGSNAPSLSSVLLPANVFSASPMAPPGAPPVVNEVAPTVRRVAPADSDRVFVDVSAYNSTYFYVSGEVGLPGRLPVTGSETVMGAITSAAGITALADPNNIRLIRPARGGKPTKTYAIDLIAITEEGDSKSNLQIFPGDRVVIGRLSKRRMSEPALIHPRGLEPLTLSSED